MPPEPSDGSSRAALGHVAIGTWSGGRYLHFGRAIEEERLEALLTPGGGISTFLTADAYGRGEADRVLGRALAGVERAAFRVVGAVGHDFYEGEREGSKGFPRFTAPTLRGPHGYADYLRMAAERSLERLGLDRLDLLLLHNPDRTGYTSEVVWDALARLRDEGLTDAIGVAPGPANGFTLDLVDCFERFGERIDWAMVILSPLEPWPGRLCLEAARRHGVRLITRVVDYGGLFWGGLQAGAELGRTDHRAFRPRGWIEAGLERVERLRPFAARHGLTPMQLACAWNLAQPPVACVAPTLIQEEGEGARPVEALREELALTPEESPLAPEEVEEMAAIGDNGGSMLLKGASPDNDGSERPDSWPLTAELEEVGRRWGIDPRRDLAHRRAG